MCVIVDKMYHLGVWLPLWSPNAVQPSINQTATITVTDGLCSVQLCGLQLHIWHLCIQ